jgi:hypothetical protein
MTQVTREELEARRAAVPGQVAAFDRKAQQRRIGEFLSDILASEEQRR